MNHPFSPTTSNKFVLIHSFKNYFFLFIFFHEFKEGIVLKYVEEYFLTQVSNTYKRKKIIKDSSRLLLLLNRFSSFSHIYFINQLTLLDHPRRVILVSDISCGVEFARVSSVFLIISSQCFLSLVELCDGISMDKSRNFIVEKNYHRYEFLDDFFFIV